MQKETLKKELKKAQQWAKDNLIGKRIFHKGINNDVLFTYQGIKHAMRARTSLEKIKLMYHAEYLLKTSILTDIQKDKKNRADIKLVYRLYNTWKYKGKEYFVYIIVREIKNECIYYDHGILNEKNPD